jgi:hypothetical protein
MKRELWLGNQAKPEIAEDLEKHCYNCASYETGENCTCTVGNHENWTPRKEAETITYNMEVDSGVNTLGGEGRGQHTAPSLLAYAQELLNEAKLHNIKVALMIKKIDEFMEEVKP